MKIWVKVFKSGLSKFCGRQPLKNLLSPLVNTLSQIFILFFIHFRVKDHLYFLNFRFLPQDSEYGGVVFNVTIFNTAGSKDYVLIILIVPESINAIFKTNVDTIMVSQMEDSPCTVPVNVSLKATLQRCSYKMVF